MCGARGHRNGKTRTSLSTTTVLRGKFKCEKVQKCKTHIVENVCEPKSERSMSAREM